MVVVVVVVAVVVVVDDHDRDRDPDPDHSHQHLLHHTVILPLGGETIEWCPCNSTIARQLGMDEFRGWRRLLDFT